MNSAWSELPPADDQADGAQITNGAGQYGLIIKTLPSPLVDSQVPRAPRAVEPLIVGEHHLAVQAVVQLTGPREEC